jgi:hypothetical protein
MSLEKMSYDVATGGIEPPTHGFSDETTKCGSIFN